MQNPIVKGCNDLRVSNAWVVNPTKRAVQKLHSRYAPHIGKEGQSDITHVTNLDVRIYTNLVTFPSQLKLTRGKGKALPLQAWTGSAGFRRLRLPDFKTIGT